jgi:hypothetical protein
MMDMLSLAGAGDSTTGTLVLVSGTGGHWD